MAAEPDQPPVDSMLDVYNDLVRAVRGGEGDEVRDLNDRLRGVFEEFGLDKGGHRHGRHHPDPA